MEEEEAEPLLLSAALEIMQDVADDVILGFVINVPDLRGQIFELVLLGDISSNTLHPGILQER